MGAGDEEGPRGERGGVLMVEDANALWEQYFVLTKEMQKFLDREDIDAFLDIAEQRNVIFDRMQEATTPEHKETDEYKAFLEKLQPIAKDVMNRAKSWLARSKQRNMKVCSYTASPGFQPNGHMVNTKY